MSGWPDDIVASMPDYDELAVTSRIMSFRVIPDDEERQIESRLNAEWAEEHFN